MLLTACAAPAVEAPPVRLLAPRIALTEFPCPDDPPLPGPGATQRALAEWLLMDEAADAACRQSLAALKAALAKAPRPLPRNEGREAGASHR